MARNPELDFEYNVGYMLTCVFDSPSHEGTNAHGPWQRWTMDVETDDEKLGEHKVFAHPGKGGIPGLMDYFREARPEKGTTLHVTKVQLPPAKKGGKKRDAWEVQLWDHQEEQWVKLEPEATTDDDYEEEAPARPSKPRAPNRGPAREEEEDDDEPPARPSKPSGRGRKPPVEDAGPVELPAEDTVFEAAAQALVVRSRLMELTGGCLQLPSVDELTRLLYEGRRDGHLASPDPDRDFEQELSWPKDEGWYAFLELTNTLKEMMPADRYDACLKGLGIETRDDLYIGDRAKQLEVAAVLAAEAKQHVQAKKARASRSTRAKEESSGSS